MGYRSNVTMLFYATDFHDFPVFKLWFDENVVPVMNEHWSEDDYKPQEFERGYAKGYALHFNDIKWYEGYPDIEAIEAAWNKFTEAFGNEESVSLGAERARIGEDYGDVEYDQTFHSVNLLNIVRVAEY